MTTADAPLFCPAERRSQSRYWIWPCRSPGAVADFIFCSAKACERVFETRFWPVLCVAIGLVPAWANYAWGFPAPHLPTALMTAALLVGACLRDDLFRGMTAVVLVVVSQSALNVTLAATDPDRLASALPAGSLYWKESRAWIVTGENPEYELSSWAPAHAQLLSGVGLLGYLSLGVTPLRFGFEQVDMMNFYVGRLIAHSESPALAMVLGWHPWSVCRGIGCLLLIFEVVSFSLQRLTGRPLSTRSRRTARWAVGIGFLLLDGIVKYTCVEWVRTVLAENLIV